MIKKKDNINIALSDKFEIDVKFSEVDSMGVVWHGNYIRYFEDGRESFGKKYGLGYLDVYQNGLMTPIVSIECNYKTMLEYGDTAIIETNYEACDAAKIIFHYNIYSKKTMQVAATGKSVQVFVNLNHELFLLMPDFYAAWKNKWGI